MESSPTSPPALTVASRTMDRIHRNPDLAGNARAIRLRLKRAAKKAGLPVVDVVLAAEKTNAIYTGQLASR